MRLQKKLIATIATLMLVVGGVLLPALPASAAVVNASTTVSPTSGIVGTQVVATGNVGFTVGSTPTVTLTGPMTAGAITNVVPAAGTVTFTVPSLPRGTYTVTITTTGGDTEGTVPTFVVNPAITVGPSTLIQGGSPIYVSGTGFIASSNILFYVDNINVGGQIQASTIGTFNSDPVTIPTNLTGGVNHYIYATDQNYPLPNYVYLTLQAKMTISTTSVAVGSAVTASGTAFTANSTVYFYLDSSGTSFTTAPTDNIGSFSSSLTIPATYGGPHTIRVQDGFNNSSDTVSFTVTSKSSIAPITGTAGTTVSVTGSGFLPNANITVTYNGATIATVPASITSDSNGNVTASFKAPVGPSNANPVSISDGSSTNTATFTSIATGSINPTKGNTGTAVQATGAGYMANHTITITYNNTNAGSATSDVNGNFTANINVPNAPSGDHTMTISDGTNSISQTFTITPNATMTPLTGFVGTNITVQGTGFTALRGVSVKYDGTDVISPAPVTDANGTLAASFKAPVSKGGNHTVIITDGNNTMTFTFAIDATPPTVPAPQLPISNTQADALPSLKWSDVTSQNLPVTYNLQLSSDAAFANLIINRTGLTVSSYTLTAAESLPNRSKQAPYYWRVQAVDGASNVSAWSAPSTFFVGFVLPSWALYVIFAVVAIILGVLGFWLGKRRAMSM